MPQDPQNTPVEGNDGKTGPGWTSPGPGGQISSSGQSGNLVDDVKLYWRKLMDTSGLEPIRSAVTASEQQNQTDIQKTVQDELNHGNPVRAAIAKYLYGGSEAALETINKVIFGATTPSNVALSIATGGESIAAQTLKAATHLYFGWRGSQELMTGRQAGETRTEEYQRRFLGGLQLVTSGEGATTGAVGAKEAMRSYVQNSLGLSGDLAAKVEARVSANEQIEKAIPSSLNQIKTEATKVISEKQGDFESRYAKLLEKATTPLTTVDDWKTEVLNSIKVKGVQDAEIAKIQNKLFAALPGNGPSLIQPTLAIRDAAALSTALSDSGMNIESIRAALARQKYRPEQIDSAFKAAFPDMNPSEEMNVSYEMSRRAKTDIWETLLSANDTTMRQGLGNALDNVNGMRQRYADSLGFGKTHSELDAEYMKFKRDLGSGTMADFTLANDYANENSNLIQAKQLINQDSGEALRGLFRLAGVDTSPLKQALEDQKAFSDLKGIVPGKSDLALAGKTGLQIRQEALRATANNARKAGITNPFAMTQILYGVAQLSFGSLFGVLHVGRGLAPSGIQKLLSSEAFQNYVAQEAGVTPEAMPKFREAISKAAPYLKKMAISTAIASSANTANQPKDKQPTVIAPASPIQISGTQ